MCDYLFSPNYFNLPLDMAGWRLYNNQYQEEETMTQKVEITKAELVRQVEQKMRLPKFALASLERANKETIKVILAQ